MYAIRTLTVKHRADQVQEVLPGTDEAGRESEKMGFEEDYCRRISSTIIAERCGMAVWTGVETAVPDLYDDASMPNNMISGGS